MPKPNRRMSGEMGCTPIVKSLVVRKQVSVFIAVLHRSARERLHCNGMKKTPACTAQGLGSCDEAAPKQGKAAGWNADGHADCISRCDWSWAARAGMVFPRFEGRFEKPQRVTLVGDG